MADFKHWWRAHRPSTRRLAQLYAALLYNAHLKGFVQGEIFTGNAKALCVPGLNCYSCPGALGSCPIGALQAVTAIVLTAYFHKAKAENTKGGIVYDAALGNHDIDA